MGNALSNAGGLDGLTGWSVNAGALSVDEVTYGAPGRAVFVGSGGSVVSPQVAVTAGSMLEVFGYVADSAGASTALAVHVGGAVAAVPKVRSGNYSAKRGLPLSFDWFYGRLASPASGEATLVAGSANSTLLMKPYLGAAPSSPKPTVWDPGSHVNPDLQLPIWPSILPPFQTGALPTPTSNATSFATDTNIPIVSDLYTQLQYDFKGQLRLDPEQFDALESFFETNRSTFYIVEPLNDRLCIAYWAADGAPKPTKTSGIWTIVEVGLHLTVA